MRYWRFLTYGVFVPLFVGVALAAGPVGNASAWSPPTISVQAEGCELANVTISNPEGVPATITAFDQLGSPFNVGQVIPPHGTLSHQVGGTGTRVFSVTVNFPDHATASTAFTFTTCPRETTTTTTPPDESTTTTAPPVSTPPPIVQCVGQPPHERTTGPEPCDPPHTMTAPKFTG